MRTKAAFLIGGAVGYVLGTRAGREQFEKIRTQARTAWQDPRVQDAVSDVEQRAAGFVKEKAPELKDLVTGAVRSATDAVRARTDFEGPGPTQNGTTSV
ncbi:MAG: YtxH domain-containing protein [Cellulomonadaceae bacterium]|nr:YtxH domain-containing protein [Cellulomonadaceae bacterium]